MFKKMPLLSQILLAVTLGILLGGVLPTLAVRAFTTFQMIFSAYLGFSIPLIILGLVVSGISNLGRRSGKILLLTVALAYGSTLFSGFLTYFSCARIFPALLNGSTFVQAPEAVMASPYFQIEIPPVMEVMTALVLAFLLGIGISSTRSEVLLSVADDFRKIIEQLIQKTILPFLPIFIFSIFLTMSANGQVWRILDVFGRIIGIVFLLHLFLLTIQFSLAGIITHRNPLKLFGTMLPAYLTALGTSSSAATIPVTLEQVKKNGVRAPIAEFCVPLCATIHLAGSTLKIVAFSLAVLVLTGGAPTFTTYFPFILLLGVTMVAAPGVPGGAIVAATALLSSVLGFQDMEVGLMIALYMTTDCFGTACNVCGDGAIALTVDHWTDEEDILQEA